MSVSVRVLGIERGLSAIEGTISLVVRVQLHTQGIKDMLVEVEVPASPSVDAVLTAAGTRLVTFADDLKAVIAAQGLKF